MEKNDKKNNGGEGKEITREEMRKKQRNKFRFVYHKQFPSLCLQRAAEKVDDESGKWK